MFCRVWCRKAYYTHNFVARVFSILKYDCDFKIFIKDIIVLWSEQRDDDLVVVCSDTSSVDASSNLTKSFKISMKNKDIVKSWNDLKILSWARLRISTTVKHLQLVLVWTLEPVPLGLGFSIFIHILSWNKKSINYKINKKYTFTVQQTNTP